MIEFIKSIIRVFIENDESDNDESDNDFYFIFG